MNARMLTQRFFAVDNLASPVFCAKIILTINHRTVKTEILAFQIFSTSVESVKTLSYTNIAIMVFVGACIIVLRFQAYLVRLPRKIELGGYKGIGTSLNVSMTVTRQLISYRILAEASRDIISEELIDSQLGRSFHESALNSIQNIVY